MDFKGKIVVITGGSSGIGLSIVKKLLTTDIKVVALFELPTLNSAKVINDLLNEYGNRIDFYPCDVTNTLLLEENFDKVLEKYKTIDILINNAGVINEKQAQLVIDINYKATVLASLMLIDRIGKHKGGKGGLIINVASVLGLTNTKVLPIYCSTKHAIVSFTRSMEGHFDKIGVKVIALCPGLTMTPIIYDFVNNYVDFVDPAEATKEFESPAMQLPESVANGLVDVIMVEGKSGDVWVAEESQPPYIVKAVEDYKNLRIENA